MTTLGKSVTVLMRSTGKRELRVWQHIQLPIVAREQRESTGLSSQPIDSTPQPTPRRVPRVGLQRAMGEVEQDLPEYMPSDRPKNGHLADEKWPSGIWAYLLGTIILGVA